jgi:hypothetical protein
VSVRKPLAKAHPALLAVAVIVLATALAGCAQFDKALGQQWVVVTFAPNTSIATAKHITSVCSHIQDVSLDGPVKPTTAQPGVIDEVRYNTTNASDAQLALLEKCLSKFPATVQGFTQMDAGDS